MTRFPRTVECIDDAMVEVLRGKSETERLAIAFGMWEFARRMIEAVTRNEHPEWPEDEIRRRVAERLSHGAI